MSDILDPWGGSSSGSDLIDPWDKAVAQQQASVLATEELPSTPQSGDAPTPVIDADLRPRPQAPQPTPQQPPPAPVASLQGSTPLSTYLVLGGIVGVLGFLLWKYTRKTEGVEGLDEVEGLGALEDFVQYALPITEKEYVVVEEISKSKKGTRVRFPESGAEIWADIQDLMSEAEAKKQGLEERT